MNGDSYMLIKSFDERVDQAIALLNRIDRQLDRIETLVLAEAVDDLDKAKLRELNATLKEGTAKLQAAIPPPTP